MSVDVADLSPDFKQRLDALIAASNGMVYITSGFRSVDEQQTLWNNAVAKYGSEDAASKWVARPGHSNHNKGVAADLGGDMGIAHQLAPQFGLYFPMPWENWHIEPLSTADPNQDPQAYTNSPFGDVNPTQQDRSQDTGFWAANFVNALTGSSGALDVSGQGGDIPATDFSNKIDPASTRGASGSDGSVDPSLLYQQLKAQGLDPVHAAALVAIAGRESGYDPTAHNGNTSTGDNSFGLFQINKLNGMHAQWSDQQLLTPEGSVAAAAALVKSGGLQPWGGYKGVAWSQGTNLQAAVDASGGEVTLAQLQGLK